MPEIQALEEGWACILEPKFQNGSVRYSEGAVMNGETSQ